MSRLASESSKSSELSNNLYDIWSDEIRIGVRAVVANDVAIAVDQELLEVPLHVTSIQLRVVSQPFVERILSLVSNRGLGHHGKLNIVLLNEVDDPFCVVRLLRTKLVARVSQDFKALVFVIFVHLD